MEELLEVQKPSYVSTVSQRKKPGPKEVNRLTREWWQGWSAHQCPLHVDAMSFRPFPMGQLQPWEPGHVMAVDVATARDFPLSDEAQLETTMGVPGTWPIALPSRRP